jgi:hypothetical protein
MPLAIAVEAVATMGLAAWMRLREKWDRIFET